MLRRAFLEAVLGVQAGLRRNGAAKVSSAVAASNQPPASATCGSPCARWQPNRTIQGFARIAEHEKGKTKFSGYFAGGFYINNVQVPGSVIAQEDLFLLWRPRRWEQVTVESLAFLDLITPAPQVVVFGCGASAQPLTPPVAAYLRDKGIQAEVLDSRNATGYFNVLNEEGRVVVGALLAPDPDVSLLETMPEQKHELHDRPFVLR